jgi:hypothetical protein
MTAESGVATMTKSDTTTASASANGASEIGASAYGASSVIINASDRDTNVVGQDELRYRSATMIWGLLPHFQWERCWHRFVASRPLNKRLNQVGDPIVAEFWAMSRSAKA